MSEYKEKTMDMMQAAMRNERYVPTHNPNETIVERFKGTPEEVYDAFEDWVAKQNKKHPDTFKIDNMATIPMPSGVFLIVTWKY